MRIPPMASLTVSLLLASSACSSSNVAVQDDPHGEPTSEAASQGSGHHGHHGGPAPLGHTFEEIARWAERFNDPTRDAWQKPAEVVGLLQLEPGMVVADIGAGTGYFEPHLAGAVGAEGKVLALDIEPGMVEYMTQAPHTKGLSQVEPKLVAVDDPMLPEGAVDRVIVVNTWHHIPERAAYVQKVVAGLKPGGVLVIVDYTMDAEDGPPVAMRLTPEAVAAELTAAGLTVEIAEESLPRQYVVMGRRR